MLIMPREERRAYSRRLRPYLFASLALFALGIVAGLVAVYRIPSIADHFQDMLANFVRMFAGMPPLRLAGAIFLNNAFKTLCAIVLGLFIGIVPVIFLLANGVALGVAMSISTQARGLWPSLLAILPHGILELPAVFLGTSIGLLIGRQAAQRLAGRAETPIGAEVLQGIKYFCTVIVPLLLVAAFVEAFLTAALVSPRN
ncbi:MAG: stage II sporulation protein M [Candidatus Binatia bacterium]